MKKLFTIIALAVCSLQPTFGQVKGQLEELEAIGEGSVFQAYFTIVKDGDKYSGDPKYKYDLKFVNNVNNKFSTFQLNEHGKDEMMINRGFGWVFPNHYTQPSMFYSKDHRLAYIYLDGLLYCIKNVKDPKNIQNFDFDCIFVLKTPAKGEHTSGKAAVKELKNRNHEEVIKKYLNDMVAVQEKATANFTDEIKAEIAAVEGKDKAVKAANKAKNDSFWQSEQGQKALATWGDKKDSPSKVTIRNTGKGILTVIYDNGYTHSINGGSKSDFSCKQNIYYGVKVNGKPTQKGQLISGANSNCGKIISASAGN